MLSRYSRFLGREPTHSCIVAIPHIVVFALFTPAKYCIVPTTASCIYRLLLHLSEHGGGVFEVGLLDEEV